MLRTALAILVLLGIAVCVLVLQITHLAIQTARSVEQTAVAIRRMMMERSNVTLEIPVEGGKVVIYIAGDDVNASVSLLTKYRRGILAGLEQVTQENEAGR